MSDGFDIRLPNLTEGSEREQLRQIKSYLYQLAEQLQYALRNSSQASGQEKQTAGTGLAFSSIKGMIIRSTEIVDAYYEIIRKRLGEIFLQKSVFTSFSEKTDTSLQAVMQKTRELDTQVAGMAVSIETTQLEMGPYRWVLREDGHYSLIS